MERAPLKGFVVSTTHVDVDTERRIKRRASALGAEFRANITDASTLFLVVGRRFSEKYDAAVKLGATLLSASAFDSVYERWERGDDLNVSRVLEASKLKTFEGLLVSTTRLTTSDVDALKLMIADGGGAHHPQLTRKCRVLVAREPVGRKWEGARAWGLPVVNLEWIPASVRAGAALNPLKFPVQPSVEGPTEPVRPMQVVPNLDVGSANSADILSIAGRTVPSGTAQNLDQLQRSQVGPLSVATNSKSLTSSVSTNTRPRRRDEWEEIRRSSKRTRLSLPEAPPQELTVTTHQPHNQESLFNGLSLWFRDFGNHQQRVLRRVVSSHGGLEVSGEKHTADLVIVPSQSPPRHAECSSKMVTEWALERSLYLKKPLRDVVDDIWCRPVLNQPTPGFPGLQVAVSGYAGVELRHIQELLKLMGATFTPTFTRERNLLVAKSPTAKVSVAATWGVIAVTGDWLWQCALNGTASSIAAEDAWDNRPHTFPKPPAQIDSAPSSHQPFARTDNRELENGPDREITPRTEDQLSNITSRYDTRNRDAWEDEHAATQVEYIDDGAEARAALLRAMQD